MRQKSQWRQVVKFLDSIPQQADIETPPETKTIPLAGHILNEQYEQKFLIVRDCYPTLFSFCESALEIEEGDSQHLMRHAVITGTAGTGKTYFGLYTAMRWYAEGKIVRFWIGESYAYFFAKELESNDPLRKVMTKTVLSNGKKCWYSDKAGD